MLYSGYALGMANMYNGEKRNGKKRSSEGNDAQQLIINMISPIFTRSPT